MSEADLDSSLIRQIFRTLSSYSVSGKIAVITGSFHGIDLVVAHVCVYAKVSHIILVGSRECTLLTAKGHLKVSVEECGASTRIYTRTADITDIDRIASIFFGVRRRIGIPDLLILCTPSRCPSRPVHEYTIEDVTQHLDLNDKSKKGFIRNFLTPGTRKRKTLIDLSIIANEHLPNLVSGQEIKAHRHFLAYAWKKGRDWFLTFHDILHGLVTTKRLGEKLNRRSQAWVVADIDPAYRLALWRLPEKTASTFDGMILGSESVLEQAKAAQLLKQRARIVNVLPEGGVQ